MDEIKKDNNQEVVENQNSELESFVGKTCPYCKTEIKEGEEIKVCSACGIPHHVGCWEENKGCTTFGCSEQHYEEQGTNPTAVCSNCGATLGDGQEFCPKCGTKKEGLTKNVCGNCGAELSEGQEFCGKCGTKAGIKINAETNAAINQFNAGLEKKKKKSKVLPIILAIIVAIVAIGGYFTYTIIQEKNMAEAVEQYKEDANSFYIKVLASGSTMEGIGNEIQTAWRKYINSSYGTYYNGEYIYSIDSAVQAAQKYKASDISTVKTSNSSIESLYKDLLVVPDTDNQELMEIKDAVKEAYDAYKDMYDCVISPSGNYTSWTSEFSSVDSEMADTIGDLGNLVR